MGRAFARWGGVLLLGGGGLLLGRVVLLLGGGRAFIRGAIISDNTVIKFMLFVADLQEVSV